MQVRPVVIKLSVCLCVCPPAYLWNRAGPIFTKFCVHISSGCGLVLLWRRCDSLRTSGVMDDVTYGRNGPHGETWRLHYHCEATTTSGVARPGRSMMSMNALFVMRSSDHDTHSTPINGDGNVTPKNNAARCFPFNCLYVCPVFAANWRTKSCAKFTFLHMFHVTSVIRCDILRSGGQMSRSKVTQSSDTRCAVLVNG